MGPKELSELLRKRRKLGGKFLEETFRKTVKMSVRIHEEFTWIPSEVTFLCGQT